MNFVTRPFGIVTVASAKISIALLILRILRNSTSKTIRYALYSSTAINTIISALDTIFTFAQCDIPAALWDSSLAPQAHCWEPYIKANFAVVAASVNVVMDFILALIPALIVWQLHMSVSRRLGLMALLGCSIISVISAAIKTSQLARPVTPDSDLTWDSYGLYAWASAEMFVLHLCASAPTFKPLWDRYIRSSTKPTPQYLGYKLSDVSTGPTKRSSRIARTVGSNVAQDFPPGTSAAHSSHSHTALIPQAYTNPNIRDNGGEEQQWEPGYPMV
ncbi:hypothetical protein GGS20DRAFT_475997 [Poronia punctata]|nr:hypothetical protein GGS20DRAFT_475997 [Poronia punctata]